MKIYFLSSRPCALTLNGAYFGLTNTFEKFAEVSPKDNLLAEFLPENASPIRFFINETLRFSPPDGCEVYLLKDGVAVFAKDFPPNHFSLPPFLQRKFPACLATLFQQGRVQLSVERDGEIFITTLPPSFSPVELYEAGEYLLVDGKTEIAVYNARAELVLHEQVLSYELVGETLKATLPLSDRLRRTAECEWELTGDEIRQIRFSLRQEGEREQASLRDELIPYAFLESVLIGADFSEFLSDELQEKSSFLREFLGEFLNVILTADPNELGLIRKKSERLFEVCYVKCKVENGKITDVQL